MDATQGAPSAPQRARTPDELRAHLEAELGAVVELKLGRSRSTPVRARPALDSWELCLHRAFLEAPEPVLDALCAWLRSGRRARRASALLDTYLEDEIASRPAPAPRGADPRGAVYDLAALAEPIYADFLRELSEDKRPVLTWGKRGPSRSRHTLRLGSFDPARRLVRVHRVLDQPTVPAWFVSSVLVHELLHAAHPPVRDAAGRWIAHHAHFRRRESEWIDAARSRTWEKRNIRGLIRSARTLDPFVETPARDGTPAAPALEAPLANQVRQGLRWLQQGLFGDRA